MATTDPDAVTLVITPASGWDGRPMVGLRRLLKAMARAYGWRLVTQTGPDGRLIYTEIPLTLEDVLHPQEGDVIPENTQHDAERNYLAGVARARVAGRGDALVLSDCLIDWGVPGVRPLAPDLAPVFGVVDPGRNRGTFRVVEEGAAPCLVVEIVSPRTRENDVVHKLALYHRARVPWYFLVDQEEEDGPGRHRPNIPPAPSACTRRYRCGPWGSSQPLGRR